MKQIFVDTSAWFAIADAADPNHEIALLFKNEITGNCDLIETNYIQDELYTLMLKSFGYDYVIDFKNKLDLLIQEDILKVVWVTEELAKDAWAIFEQFNTDKQWSFTDCVSYVVMKQLGITEVFAFDHHFTQMGFVKRPS